ncbi:hypothetical protein [Riemerella columbipharyngis]|uniref:Uncharacterized protein n=1 Tax=Riemerella columbipharyngis TaxID=1071918 RepID=A0A1G7AWC1_9FLAO|nr:hypothetical protein [Riemerella columbipharyngis]SDE19174.1 hypothetical protein SAMN05421544_104123 [Riemerella columbipharyngis]
MKKILLTSVLGLFVMCNSQKKLTLMENKNEIVFGKYLFYSATNGGSASREYRILKNQQELDKVLNGENSGLFLVEKDNKSKDLLKFPKNQKVIYYALGEFRSGVHTPKGIDSIKVSGDDLEVYLKGKEKTKPFSPGQMQYVEQIVTRPWMVFSVPSNFEFKNIVLK